MKRFIIIFSLFFNSVHGEDKIDDIINYARQFQGTKYQWGGIDPQRGIDCSAFVRDVYKKVAGINIPRTSNQQLFYGKPVNLEQVQKGDLVFFKTNNKKTPVDHVGMYIGSGYFIHSSSSGKGVAIAPLMNWAKHLVAARRIDVDSSKLQFTSFGNLKNNTYITSNGDNIPIEIITIQGKQQINFPAYTARKIDKYKRTNKRFISSNNNNRPLKGDL